MKSKFLMGVLAAAFCGASWAGMVNVNSADAKTLSKELAGVGNATATAIVEERTAHGPFKDGQDLAKRVKGVGKKTLEKNQANLKF
jgi:competence protein ComEA